MTAPFGNISEAQDYMNDLTEYEGKLGRWLLNLQEEMESVKDLQAATLRWIETKRAGSRNNGCPPILFEDVRHCLTQRAVLREWALRNDGRARIRDVAKFIMQTNLAKGSEKSVLSSLSSYAAASKLWERTGPGEFRLLEGVCNCSLQSAVI